MKLSEILQQAHDGGNFGKALEGYAERAKDLEDELERYKKAVDYCEGGNLCSCSANFG
jgi:hypothetical protein